MNTVERIFEVLKARGITPSKMLKDLGFSSGLMSQWKSGAQKPSLDKLIKMAEYLKVPLDYLVGISDTPVLVGGNSLNDDEVKLLLLYRQHSEQGKQKILSQAKYLQ